MESQWNPDHVILQATVGSTAYGLAREGSDIDTLGVFALPTDAFWTLTDPIATYHTTSPDLTHHEVAKFLRLALQCNPTLLELLWLPDHLYQEIDHWGERLREIRHAFLSESRVRSAFGGYAKQQIERLVRRQSEGKAGFSSDTQKRTAKHARHCFRLLRQGKELLETGKLTVRVENPSEYWAFDDMSVDEIVVRFAQEDLGLQAAISVLPPMPATNVVQGFLYDLRRSHL